MLSKPNGSRHHSDATHSPDRRQSIWSMLRARLTMRVKCRCSCAVKRVLRRGKILPVSVVKRRNLSVSRHVKSSTDGRCSFLVSFMLVNKQPH